VAGIIRRAYDGGMASLDAVQRKISRAKEHWEELWEELTAYYKSDPGDLFPAAASTPENPVFIFKEKNPVPAKIALVMGDALQCLRSSLDYLVWELVEAGGNVPHRRLMFPIAMTLKQYKDDLDKRHRLDGVPPRAAAIIDRFQPYRDPNPKETVLGILEELTNVNKHRRMIFTGLHGTVNELPSFIPHVVGVVRWLDGSGKLLEEVTVRGTLTLQEGLSKSIEVTNCVDTVARLISEQMLPLFEPFFK
jgi:hypothetical protein